MPTARYAWEKSTLTFALSNGELATTKAYTEVVDHKDSRHISMGARPEHRVLDNSDEFRQAIARGWGQREADAWDGTATDQVGRPVLMCTSLEIVWGTRVEQ